jgi:hypothetical protein
VNIEYFADGAIDTPLILIFGDDPIGVEKLRLALENLVNDQVCSNMVCQILEMTPIIYIRMGICERF